MTTEGSVVWGCDDTNEGTLHNGVGDARVNGLASQMQTDEQTADCIATLEASRREARERSRALAEAATAAAPMAHPAPSAGSSSTPLPSFFAPLQHFALRDAGAGGAELKLYDAMLSPDRQLIRANYFVAEGSLVVQQVLSLPSVYRCASILSTEAQLRKLLPDMERADAEYTAAADAPSATADAADGDGSGEGGASADSADSACVVFAGNKRDVSSATGFKHSALSILAIVHRPPHAHVPLGEWVRSLRPAAGTSQPTLLVLDGVVKPENVGALFRTALAFGVAGVVLSPGCADPLYRKAIRSSMGGCFKLPYVHAPTWPVELDELKGKHGYKLLALHLRGAVAHDVAIGGGVAPAGGGGGAARAAQPMAVMVGAEYEGVGEEGAARADVCVRIPMSDVMEGSLDSLNVNVAAAIVLERVFAANRAA